MPKLVKDRYGLLRPADPPKPPTGEQPEPNAGRDAPPGTGWES
jgi:hypothetical protein